jgi:hypothetical protein
LFDAEWRLKVRESVDAEEEVDEARLTGFDSQNGACCSEDVLAANKGRGAEVGTSSNTAELDSKNVGVTLRLQKAA